MKYKDIITGEVMQVLTVKKGASRRELMKEVIRQTAIEWQANFPNHDYSLGELLYFQGIFEKYGKRYGLLREFRENGII